jgi:hypothetical protein
LQTFENQTNFTAKPVFGQSLYRDYSGDPNMYQTTPAFEWSTSAGTGHLITRIFEKQTNLLGFEWSVSLDHFICH